MSKWPSVRTMRWGVATLIGVGVVLRLVRYLADRSLWLDEAYLAINLMTRSYGDLLETLDYNQGAPVGFLWIEKLMLSLFGDGEFVLRLFPLAVSLLALMLFYLVARDVLAGVGLLVALLLFATMEPFVHYAAEVKQYGLDIGVTVALLLLFVSVVEHGPMDVPRTVLLALAGPLAVFFSHPSVFVLAGTAAGGLFLGFRRGATTELRRQLAAYAVWVAAFAVVYVVAVRDLEELRRTVSSVGAGATGGAKNLYTIFNAPGGMPRTAVGLAAALVLSAPSTSGAAALASSSSARAHPPRSWPPGSWGRTRSASGSSSSCCRSPCSSSPRGSLRSSSAPRACSPLRSSPRPSV